MKQDWLSPLYSGRLEYICWNSFYPPRCIDALFGVRIPFRSLIQRLIQIPVQSPIHVYTGHRTPVGNWYPTPIYPMIAISENTRTPGLSITFGTLSACRSFEMKDYQTFSHCFCRISFCSCVYMYILGMCLTFTVKANHSRQKQIAHGKSKLLSAKTNSLTAKVN